ncbi:hypothetical protein, partial [Burkholderia stagnalis]|uniref:hypothetical protein n=1 Tax=Burkholderia stagnalis TaxID=1503054 RepID=UPI00076D246D
MKVNRGKASLDAWRTRVVQDAGTRPGQMRSSLLAIPMAVIMLSIAQGSHAQALADQSLEERLTMLMKVVDEQQR